MSATTPRRVGYIGLGNLGFHLAHSLLKAGHHVTVTDLNAALAEPLLAAGAQWADTAKGVAEASDVVFTCLPSPQVIDRVVTGPDGILAGLAAGGTWIDNSTNDQEETLRLAAICAERGVRMLESPVTGGVHKAAAGDITVLVGGKVLVEAWDRELKAKLATGELTAVDNQVDVATGTVKLKATFRNEDAALFPNQFVNVRMKLETLSNATIVPAAAIQRGAQSLFVYVVKDDNRVTARPVKLGPQDGNRVAVTEGVAAGEVVVVDGIDRLREGATVALAQRPEFKGTVDGQAEKKGGAGRWMSLTDEQKKAAWEKMSPEQKARITEAKAKREAEAKKDGAKPDAPKAEAPKADAPKPEAKKDAAPKAEPKKDAASKADVPAKAEAVPAAAPATPSAEGAPRKRWREMDDAEKKAAWPTLPPEIKARILEAKAKREAEAKGGN